MAAGTVLDTGTATLTVTFTPANATRYTPANASRGLVVNPPAPVTGMAPATGSTLGGTVVTLAGLDFAALIGRFREAEAKLAGKAAIMAALKENGEAWASWVDGLPDQFLAERVQMPGEQERTAGQSPAGLCLAQILTK